MDNLLIFILATLTGFGFSGVATFLYFIWLCSGFVKTEWTTLSSFTALMVYWFYGLFGLVFLGGSVISTVCALAMFWFDMSLQDIQEKAHESVNEARPEDERKQLKPSVKPSGGDDDTTLLDMSREQFCQRTGMSDEEFEKRKQKYLTAYRGVADRFDGIYNVCYSGVLRARELTDEIPVITLFYYYFDLVRKEINTYIKAVLSLKELSKLSRAGFGDPNGAPDFSALQNIDIGALLGGLEAMGMGGNAGNESTSDSTTSSETTSTQSADTKSAPAPAFPFPPMGGMGGMGGFDMSQMAELERIMTPEQKRQAEQAAMSMLQNFDLGNMMSMFGPPPSSQSGGQSGSDNQNLTRSQKRKLKKLQKKNK
jgi:hypothetical protein